MREAAAATARRDAMRPKQICNSRDCQNRTKLGHDYCHGCLITIASCEKAARTKAAGGKECSKCGKWTILEGFAIASQNADGRQGACKACNSVDYHAKYKDKRTRGGVRNHNTFDMDASARLLSMPMGRSL